MEKKKKCKKNLTLVGFEPAACSVESHIATYLTTKLMHSGACKLLCYCNCYFCYTKSAHGASHRC